MLLISLISFLWVYLQGMWRSITVVQPLRPPPSPANSGAAISFAACFAQSLSARLVGGTKS